MNTNPLPHGYRRLVARLASLTAAAILLCPGPSHAQPASNDQSEPGALHRKGKTAYDVGNFEEAIAYFKRAYALQPHEAHLYNIAQAYRQVDDCRNALFFFKRYVAVGGEEARHYEVAQRRIKELTPRCKSADGLNKQPPRDLREPERVAGETKDDATTESTSDGVTITGSPLVADSWSSDSVLAASLEVGGAALDIGELETTGAHFSLGVGAGYPLDFGKLGVTLGGLFTYTPVPWLKDSTGKSGTAAMMGAIGNVGVRYAMSERLALRLEAGAGLLFLTSVSQGSVFLPEDMMNTSALSMLHLRVGIGAEYPIAHNLVLSVSPLVFSYSPAKAGMDASVEQFVRVDFIAGLGYRM